MGHLSADEVKKLAKGMVEGITISLGSDLPSCEACTNGKQHGASPLPNESSIRMKDLLEIIHTSVCGPMSVDSISKAKYYLTFINDKTCMTFVYFIKHKNEVFGKFLEF